MSNWLMVKKAFEACQLFRERINYVNWKYQGTDNK